MSTKIEWVRNPDGTPGKSWNPISGCSKVSAGCLNCYAERMDRRQMMHGRQDGFRSWCSHNAKYNVRLHPERLEQPLRWRKPLRVFVNSMSDLFHEQVPDEFIDRVFAVMAQARSHTFLLLTKRPRRMATWFNNFKRTADSIRGIGKRGGIMPEDQLLKEAWHTQSNSLTGGPFTWPLPNVQLGISAEDQKTFDERARWLRQTPAAVRFVSLEPLLGAIDVSAAVWPTCWEQHGHEGECFEGPALDQIIVGGESGPGARPMHPAWPVLIRDQCQAAGVPFFFKQHGEWVGQDDFPGPLVLLEGRPNHAFMSSAPHLDGTVVYRVGKKAAGRELDGRTWDEMLEAR